MKIKIYTIESCKFCILAKNLLISKNMQFEEIPLDNKYEELETLIKETNKKTVPQIFINNKFIGGYDELKKIIEEKQSI